ncbi:MAG: PilZ domain-containing protein [Candidatus Omnitrophica bacterium]|nr:PilZ domain-containing protein [Candidatus Omnitrophota bacterium]
MVPTERRSFPRIADSGLSLKLHSGDFDAITHTLNISASGIYCKLDKEIPLMSRVNLVLMLPDSPKNEDAPKKIEVSGVVVREHPVIIDGKTKHFDVAIFFEDLSQKQRDMISGYISRKISKR